jgi:hypothetical protein
MPKRMKDKNKSIFVKFYDDVTDQEACKLMASIGVTGSRVSTLIKRWAIEVPFWREDFYCEKFAESEFVERIHEGPERKKFQEETGEEE